MTTHLSSSRVTAGPRRPARWALQAAWLLAAVGVLAQMSFPLTDGGTMAATLLCVAGLAGAAIAHAAATRGPAAAVRLVVVAGGGGLAAEALGVATGVPFGAYHYTDTLGPAVFGVPLIVPAAWVMMLHPSLVVARRLVGRAGPTAVAVVGAWAMTTWDVFLDPQLVDAGHWVWDHPEPSLPGVSGIPVTNFVGWLAVSFVLCRLTIRSSNTTSAPAGDGLAVGLCLWTYCSFLLADAAFFGRPAVALTGGLLMGTVAVPLAIAQLRGTRG